MWYDPDEPNSPDSLRAKREHARLVRLESRRQDLLAAARVMIPAHGLALPLGRIAVAAGVARHAASALFNSTADLAALLVVRDLYGLIESVVARDGGTPAGFLAHAIARLREAAPALRIGAAMDCGTEAYQRAGIAHAESLLDLALGEGLRATLPALARTPPGPLAAIGHRALVLARAAAIDPAAPDPADEAADIAAMLAPLLADLLAALPVDNDADNEDAAEDTAGAAAFAAVTVSPHATDPDRPLCFVPAESVRDLPALATPRPPGMRPPPRPPARPSALPPDWPGADVAPGRAAAPPPARSATHHLAYLGAPTLDPVNHAA